MRLRTASCLCGPRVRSRQTFFARDAGRSPTRGRADPTGTASIQRRWSRDLDQRWRSIKQMLPRAIEDRMSPVDHIMHSALTGKSDPVLAFQGWLDEAMRQIVLGINGARLLPYVRQATDVGALHARTSTESASDQPPADRTHLLQSLAIAELQGIIEAVSQRVVRAFANGYLAHKSPSAIATDCRAAVDAVGVQRGRLLASFMVVRAHAAATLDGFRARGISRVGLVPELVPPAPVIGDAKSTQGMISIQTAEDKDVCDECQEIADDGPYYLDEAESLIPAHPNCRCTFVPADDEEYADLTGLEAEDAFDPDEARDDHGKWTSGGSFSGKDADARYRAVASYQGNGYKTINKELCGSGKLSPKLQETVKHLDNAIKSSTVNRALKVYRGVSATKDFNPDLFVPGKTITLKGFTSTTMNSKTAEDFVHGSKKAVRFEIEVPKGAHALEVKGQEGELILPRNAKFKVLGGGHGGDAKQARAAVEVARAKMTKSPSVANLKAFNKAQDVLTKSKDKGSVVRLKLVH